MSALHQKMFESEIDVLLSTIVPQPLTNKRRSEVFEFLKRILINVIDCRVVLSGSFPLRTYLPESDLDVIILPTNAIDAVETTDTILSVFKALCDNVVKDDSRRIYPEMTIRNIEFVNARTKLAHCVINNMNVDITVNQIGALSSSCFLEEADRLIGNNHLFKRSLILIKSWCLNDSIRYNSIGSIAGSKCGMLSSYALSILVLYVFNLHARSSSLHHPFSVFRGFLLTYSSFPWDRYALSLDGLIPINNGSFGNTVPTVINLFHTITNRVKNSSNYQDNISISTNTTTATQNTSPMFHKINGNGHHRFQIRACNIVDPIDTSNNLGISVTPANLAVIDFTLKSAVKEIEGALQWHLLHASDAFASQQIFQNLQLHNNSKSGSFNGHHVSMTIPIPILIAPGCDSNYLSTSTTTSNPPFAGVSSFDPTARTHTQPQQHTSQPQSTAPNLFTPLMIDSHQQVFQTLPSNRFLRNFFPCSVDRYLNEGSVRSDLLDHPLQQGMFISRATAAFSPLPPPAQTHGETASRSKQCRRSFDETEYDPLLGDLAAMREACCAATSTTPTPYSTTTNGDRQRCQGRSLWNTSNTTSPVLSSTSNSSTLLDQGLYAVDSEPLVAPPTDRLPPVPPHTSPPLPPSATAARYRSRSEGMAPPPKVDSNTTIVNWTSHSNRSLLMDDQEESMLCGIAEEECYHHHHHLNKESDAASTLLDTLHRASCEPTPSVDGSLTDSENSQQEECHNNKYSLHLFQDGGHANTISRGGTSSITSFSAFQHSNSHSHGSHPLDHPSSHPATLSSSLRLAFPDIITGSISTDADGDVEVEVENEVRSISFPHNVNLHLSPLEEKCYDDNVTHVITSDNDNNNNYSRNEESSATGSNNAALYTLDSVHENKATLPSDTCITGSPVTSPTDNLLVPRQFEEGSLPQHTDPMVTITPPSQSPSPPPLALPPLPTEIESVALSLMSSSQNSNCNNSLAKPNNKSKKSNNGNHNRDIKTKNKNNVKYCNAKINQNSSNNNIVSATRNNNNNDNNNINNKPNVNNNNNSSSSSNNDNNGNITKTTNSHLVTEISNIELSENKWRVGCKIGSQIISGCIEEWSSLCRSHRPSASASASRRLSAVRVLLLPLSSMIIIIFLYYCCQRSLSTGYLTSWYPLSLGKSNYYHSHSHSHSHSSNMIVPSTSRIPPTSLPSPVTLRRVVYWVREGASFSIETQDEDEGEGGGDNNDTSLVSEPLSSSSFHCSEGSSYPGCESSSVASSQSLSPLPLPATYQWTKDHQILANQTKRLLTLREMTVADEGVYRCYLTTAKTIPSSDSAATATATTKAKSKAENEDSDKLVIGLGKLVMDVHIRLSAPPKCRTKPSHHMLTTGSDLLLHVRAEGIPPPSYQWMRNGYPLPFETNASLVTRYVSKAHEGTYSCLIENVAGSMVWLEATVVVRLSR